MNIKFKFYADINLKDFIDIGFPYFFHPFYTFSIVTVVMFKYTQKLMHEFENCFQQQNIDLQALKLW